MERKEPRIPRLATLKSGFNFHKVRWVWRLIVCLRLLCIFYLTMSLYLYPQTFRNVFGWHMEAEAVIFNVFRLTCIIVPCHFQLHGLYDNIVSHNKVRPIPAAQQVEFLMPVLPDVLSVDGLFGRRGPYYFVRIYAGGVLEIFAESFQVIYISQYMQMPLLPITCLGIITLNSLLIVIRARTANNEFVRRSVCILCDCFFATCFAVIIPTWILIESRTLKTATTDIAGVAELDNGVYYLLQGRAIFMNTYVRSLSFCIPFVTMHALLCELSHTIEDETRKFITQQLALHAPRNSLLIQRSKNSERFKNMLASKKVQFMKSIYIDGLFFLGWNCLLWYLCFSSRSRPCPDWCKLKIHPPFTNTCTCMKAVLDCSAMKPVSDNVFPSTIGPVPIHMPYLYLNACNGSDLQQTFRTFIEVKYLHLENWTPQMYSTQKPLLNITSVTGLHVQSKKPWSKLPEEFIHLPEQLVSIKLQPAQLSHIQVDVQATWQNVQFLRLSENAMKTFPVALIALRSLNFLDLSHNQLTELPPQIGLMKSLRDLDVGYNNLTSLPPELSNIHLHELITEGNPFSD